MTRRGTTVSVRPAHSTTLAEAETWDVFAAWLIKTFAYLAVRKGYDALPGRETVTAARVAPEDGRRLLEAACAAAREREPAENAHVEKAIDIVHSHRVEIDLNPEVESQLAQIACFMDYLEDCYGTRIVIKPAACGD